MTVIETKGSLCSGTGALDAAVPGELTWYAESDPAAAKLLEREQPNEPNLGDITTMDWRPYYHVDVLTSGDPCQSMSAAGRQNASGDERFLWPFVLDAIVKLRPREIFLENVQNLTSVPLVKGATDWTGQRGSVLKLRLDDLHAAGYAVRWTVLGACAVGAPHHRHRWFLRATYVGSDAPIARKIDATCGAPRTGGRNLLPTPTTRDGMGGPGTSGREGGMNLRTAVLLLPTPLTRDADGRGEGSAAYWERRGGYRSNGMPLGAAVRLMPERWGDFAEAVRLWETVIGRPAPDATERAPRGGRRLSASFAEWMMDYPEGYLTKDFDRREALRMAGNGVVTRQARAAWDLLA